MPSESANTPVCLPGIDISRAKQLERESDDASPLTAREDAFSVAHDVSKAAGAALKEGSEGISHCGRFPLDRSDQESLARRVDALEAERLVWIEEDRNLRATIEEFHSGLVNVRCEVKLLRRQRKGSREDSPWEAILADVTSAWERLYTDFGKRVERVEKTRQDVEADCQSLGAAASGRKEKSESVSETNAPGKQRQQAIATMKAIASGQRMEPVERSSSDLSMFDPKEGVFQGRDGIIGHVATPLRCGAVLDPIGVKTDEMSGAKVRAERIPAELKTGRQLPIKGNKRVPRILPSLK